MDDLITIIKQYWPTVVTVVALVTAVLVVIIKWQTIRANRLNNQNLKDERNERAKKLSRDAEGIRFEKIRVDPNNTYWKEGWYSQPPFPNASDQPKKIYENTKQTFSLTEVVEGADPSFDIILFNPGDHETSILSVGVRVVRVINYSYSQHGVAGDIPKAEKLNISEEYHVNMPNIWGQVCRIDFDETDIPAEVNELIKCECDPYVLQPGARFRYTFFLKYYAVHMPQEAILKMYVETNDGGRESHEIYIRYIC